MKGIDFSHLKLSKPKKRPKMRQPRLLEQKPNWELVKQGLCGLCGTKLRWDKMSDKIRCRSKKSRDGFFISQESYENLLSGKTLNDYKQQRKELLK